MILWIQTEDNSYDEDGELSWKNKYKYDEFDKKNNWTTRTEYENDKPVGISEREIEYYE